MSGVREDLVVVRGAGDIATGVIQRLAHAGFRVAALEAGEPTAIRWRAALCPAVKHGEWVVEDLVGKRVSSASEATTMLYADRPAEWTAYGVPVLVDPDAACLTELRPVAVVDAILAKRNCGTSRAMAPVTVGCGPGFTAGEDVDVVVETMRGHDLGRLYLSGDAIPNTGIPGLIAGRAAERVIHAPVPGVVTVYHDIGEVVDEGAVICTVADDEGNETPVPASLAGVIRGMIPGGFAVREGFKIADIDPRVELADSCDTISDKSRAVGGAALAAVLLGLARAGRSPIRYAED